MMDGAYTLAGALTGFVVGLTGVGGGALMTPILLLVFGVNLCVRFDCLTAPENVRSTRARMTV